MTNYENTPLCTGFKNKWLLLLFCIIYFYLIEFVFCSLKSQTTIFPLRDFQSVHLQHRCPQTSGTRNLTP